MQEGASHLCALLMLVAGRHGPLNEMLVSCDAQETSNEMLVLVVADALSS